MHQLLQQHCLNPEDAGFATFYTLSMWINLHNGSQTMLSRSHLTPTSLYTAGPCMLQLSLASLTTSSSYSKSIRNTLGRFLPKLLSSACVCVWSIPRSSLWPGAAPLVGRAGYEYVEVLRGWLQEHPAHEQQLRGVLEGAGFCDSLWSCLPVLLKQIWVVQGGRSRVCGVSVPEDHNISPFAAAAAAGMSRGASSSSSTSVLGDGGGTAAAISGSSSAWSRSSGKRSAAASSDVAIAATAATATASGGQGDVALLLLAATEGQTYQLNDMDSALVCCLHYTYGILPVEGIAGQLLENMRGSGMAGEGNSSSGHGSSSSNGSSSGNGSSSSKRLAGGSSAQAGSSSSSNGSRPSGREGNCSGPVSAGRSQQGVQGKTTSSNRSATNGLSTGGSSESQGSYGGSKHASDEGSSNRDCGSSGNSSEQSGRSSSGRSRSGMTGHLRSNSKDGCSDGSRSTASALQSSAGSVLAAAAMVGSCQEASKPRAAAVIGRQGSAAARCMDTAASAGGDADVGQGAPAAERGRAAAAAAAHAVMVSAAQAGTTSPATIHAKAASGGRVLCNSRGAPAAVGTATGARSVVLCSSSAVEVAGSDTDCAANGAPYEKALAGFQSRGFTRRAGAPDPAGGALGRSLQEEADSGEKSTSGAGQTATSAAGAVQHNIAGAACKGKAAVVGLGSRLTPSPPPPPSAAAAAAAETQEAGGAAATGAAKNKPVRAAVPGVCQTVAAAAAAAAWGASWFCGSVLPKVAVEAAAPEEEAGGAADGAAPATAAGATAGGGADGLTVGANEAATSASWILATAAKAAAAPATGVTPAAARTLSVSGSPLAVAAIAGAFAAVSARGGLAGGALPAAAVSLRAAAEGAGSSRVPAGSSQKAATTATMSVAGMGAVSPLRVWTKPRPKGSNSGQRSAAAAGGGSSADSLGGDKEKPSANSDSVEQVGRGEQQQQEEKEEGEQADLGQGEPGDTEQQEQESESKPTKNPAEGFFTFQSRVKKPVSFSKGHSAGKKCAFYNSLDWLMVKPKRQRTQEELICYHQHHQQQQQELQRQQHQSHQQQQHHQQQRQQQQQQQQHQQRELDPQEQDVGRGKWEPQQRWCRCHRGHASKQQRQRSVVSESTIEWLFLGPPTSSCSSPNNSNQAIMALAGLSLGHRGVREEGVGPAAAAGGGRGSAAAAAAGLTISEQAPPPPTAAQLQQILELLLLVWPAHGGAAGNKGKTQQQQQQQQAGKADVKQQQRTANANKTSSSSSSGSFQQGEQEEEGEDPVSGECAVEWLLLLAVLLQQAGSEAKVELLQQRGTLLLQLLYHVLLQDPALGGQMVSGLQVTSRAAAAEMMDDAAAGEGAGEGAGAGGRYSKGDFEDYPLHLLVLLVMQSLVYEPVGWEDLGQEGCKGARLLESNLGELIYFFGQYCRNDGAVNILLRGMVEFYMLPLPLRCCILCLC